MCVSLSFFVHAWYPPTPAFVPFHQQNVLHMFPPFLARTSRFDDIVGTDLQFSTFRYDHLRGWLANSRTSMGIFVGTPLGPGTVESRPAIA
jgi:hypothetical protein